MNANLPDKILLEAREELVNLQQQMDATRHLIKVLEPKKKRRRRVKKRDSMEAHELDGMLRNNVVTVGLREEERKQIVNGERELVYATSGGRQDD